MAYEGTTVEIPKSQAEIRKHLVRAGADRVAFHEQLTGDSPAAAVEFLHRGLLVRVVCSVPTPSEEWLSDKESRTRSGKTRRDFVAEFSETEGRRIWRVLHWSIKARMEAVAEGLETFEQAFLPHLVDPRTNRTVWESVRPQIDDGALNYVGGSGLLELGAG